MNSKRFVCAASLALVTLPTSAAHAAVVVNFVETGAGVVATTTGSLDLTGLVFLGSNGAETAFLLPSVAGFISKGGSLDVYSGLSGPTGFGEGVLSTGQGAGDGFAVRGILGADLIGVPSGYLSNTAIAATTIFAGRTFQAVGLMPGTYVFQTPADTITFNIGVSLAPAVPEPGTWALMLLGFGGIGVAMRRHRRVGSTAQIA